MPEFCIIIARKIFSRFSLPPPLLPVSYAHATKFKASQAGPDLSAVKSDYCDRFEIFERRSSCRLHIGTLSIQ